MIRLYSSSVWTSRRCFPESFGSSTSLINDVNYSLFHNGLVHVITAFVSPFSVYLTPVAANNQNSVNIRTHSYMWQIYPLVQVSQTAGSFTRNTITVLTALPLTGYVKLDMFSTTLARVYSHPHNVYEFPNPVIQQKIMPL